MSTAMKVIMDCSKKIIEALAVGKFEKSELETIAGFGDKLAAGARKTLANIQAKEKQNEV